MPQPAKSAALQLIQGNPNKKNTDELKRRAEKEEQLKMETDKIKPPNFLNKDGKKAFKFLKEELLNIELISNGDVYHLAMYCDALAEYMQYSKIIKADGYVETVEIIETEFSDEGEGIKSKEYKVTHRKPHPLASKLDKSAMRVRSFGNDIGLTPASRAKLAIKMAQEDDDDDF
ncbi:phage terminase small subunit P27 family [Listeria monocytogenes]|nr:phage terminase small subunit P27 family [Listeria monocytogenes]